MDNLSITLDYMRKVAVGDLDGALALCSDEFVFTRREAFDAKDATILHTDQRVLDHSIGTHEPPRRYRPDHRCPFTCSAR